MTDSLDEVRASYLVDLSPEQLDRSLAYCEPALRRAHQFRQITTSWVSICSDEGLSQCYKNHNARTKVQSNLLSVLLVLKICSLNASQIVFLLASTTPWDRIDDRLWKELKEWMVRKIKISTIPASFEKKWDRVCNGKDFANNQEVQHLRHCAHCPLLREAFLTNHSFDK
jgi:hypothetical protein